MSMRYVADRLSSRLFRSSRCMNCLRKRPLREHAIPVDQLAAAIASIDSKRDEVDTCVNLRTT